MIEQRLKLLSGERGQLPRDLGDRLVRGIGHRDTPSFQWDSKNEGVVPSDPGLRWGNTASAKMGMLLRLEKMKQWEQATALVPGNWVLMV
jgi:hypothetical protein